MTIWVVDKTLVYGLTLATGPAGAAGWPACCADVGGLVRTADSLLIPVDVTEEAVAMPTPVRCTIRPRVLFDWGSRNRPPPEPPMNRVRLRHLAARPDTPCLASVISLTVAPDKRPSRSGRCHECAR